MSHQYRPAVLDELLDHGIRPGADTPPERVKDLLNDLYCYELRVVRARLARREFPKTDYARQVVEIRSRYPLLSVPLEQWTMDAASEAGGGTSLPASAEGSGEARRSACARRRHAREGGEATGR